ncbi:hypothetical protein LIA77_00031 [Sarocladium implicatum]|nr:hypothetical protein LIA77_00031 [Sarocladium implicatum]
MSMRRLKNLYSIRREARRIGSGLWRPLRKIGHKLLYQSKSSLSRLFSSEVGISEVWARRSCTRAAITEYDASPWLAVRRAVALPEAEAPESGRPRVVPAQVSKQKRHHHVLARVSIERWVAPPEADLLIAAG